MIKLLWKIQSYSIENTYLVLLLRRQDFHRSRLYMLVDIDILTARSPRCKFQYHKLLGLLHTIHLVLLVVRQLLVVG
jgi:hypothetical protein